MTGAEVGSCRLALAEVPAVVGVASDIVQGLPSRAWLLFTYAVQRHAVCDGRAAKVWATQPPSRSYRTCLVLGHGVKDSLTDSCCQVSLDTGSGTCIVAIVQRGWGAISALIASKAASVENSLQGSCGVGQLDNLTATRPVSRST